MSRRFYTIFILPHAHARFRKIHLSRNFVFTLAAIVVGVLAAGAVAPHLFLKVQTQSEAVDILERENRRLREENERFEASLSEIATRLSVFEETTGKLAEAAGLGELAPPPAGGAAVQLPDVGVQGMLEEELDALRRRTTNLDGAVDQLHAALEERVRLLASTPATMPAEGFFSDGYGWRKDPFSGTREFHRGLDIVAPTGSPIVATADGVVVRAGRMSGYGKMVQLSHGFGFATRYGHMSEVLVRPGQRVRRGDLIGRIGSTGRSTGPHVHYEVWKGNRQVNPWRYLGRK